MHHIISRQSNQGLRLRAAADLRLHWIPMMNMTTASKLAEHWLQSYPEIKFVSTTAEHFAKDSGMEHLVNGVWRVRVEFPKPEQKEATLNRLRGKKTV